MKLTFDHPDLYFQSSTYETPSLFTSGLIQHAERDTCNEKGKAGIH